MTDIEIANSVKLKNIKEIGRVLGISDKLITYGDYKAKIDTKIANKHDSKLILVTSTSPTPYGEGKTTVSIGLNDALRRIGKSSVVVLREPSMGPVFGIKGGAAGGGYSQVVPMEDINLHFTGDIHAIELANNLLCAIIDNHIYQGNKLKIKQVVFNRCIDLNDRALRNITINYENGYKREDHFNITVASEIMALLCLSSDMNDLKKRIGNILIGYNEDNEMVFARDLDCVGSIATILKDAIKPNLVQTLEGNPAIIHGGPFANIAHGCNSLIATKLGLGLCDYVVTEAGFGADLGAEKFFDIKCQIGNLKPNCVVLNTTIRSLKYNGYDNLEKGISNLERHINNLLKYTKNIVVCINKFDTDKECDIEFVHNFVEGMGISCTTIETYKMGSIGGTMLANKVVEICNREVSFKPLYNLEEDIEVKINKIAKEIYGAKNVIISDEISDKIKMLKDNNFNDLPICMAKTQYSFSDNKELLGAPSDFNVTIKDIKLSSGAGFIVVLLGNIMTMPGLGKDSAYKYIDIDSNYKISGLF